MSVRCQKCQTENPSDSIYCRACGTQFDLPAENQVTAINNTTQGTIDSTLEAVIAGKFRIIETLGKGGMGVVYKAEDTMLKREVALKFLSPDLVIDTEACERLIIEAQAASRLDHPNICTIYEIGETEDGRMYIAMPYYQGTTLKEKIRSGEIELEEGLDIIRQMAQGLAKAQGKGITHRDIKPANVIVTEDGLVKVVDFGVAKLAGMSRITKTGATMGTVAYMSPEQVQGEEVDSRTDIWSLGVVMYEILTGQLPFKGESEQSVLYSIINNEPEQISNLVVGLPEELGAMVVKALQKDATKRYQSFDEFLAGLKEVYKQLELKPEWRVPLRVRLGRRKWIVSPFLWTPVVALAALVLGLILFYPTQAIPFQERDWILITDFENLTGDEVFDRSLSSAMTVSMRQSSYVNIFPQSRIKQTLKRMKREFPDRLDLELAAEIAVRENVKILLSCSIYHIGDVYSLSASLIDPHTQVALKTETIRAKGKNDVLNALDDLAVKIRSNLGESMKDIQEQNLMLPQATTSSLEALKKLAEGLRFWRANKWEEAAALYREAIEVDPDFAWAHASLAAYYFWFNQRPKGEEHMTKALSLEDRLTERERLWVQTLAVGWRGNHEEAIRLLEIYLSRYPDDNIAWYNLGNHFMRSQKFDEALESYAKSLAINPFHASSYINIATCYNTTGQFEPAVQNYQKAFEIRPEDETGRFINHEYGFALVGAREYQKARQTFEKMLSGGDLEKAKGNRSLALLAMYQGKYTLATKHFNEALICLKAIKAKQSEIRERVYLASVYNTKNQKKQCLRELEVAISGLENVYIPPFLLAKPGKILARLGEIESCRQVLEMVSTNMNSENRADQADYNMIKGEILLAEGQLDQALEALTMAYNYQENNYFLESLAQVHVKRGEPDKAILRYEELIKRRQLGWEAQEYWILAHYHLGRLYEEKGERDKASQYYQDFLNIWKEADPDIPMLIEARNRLAELQ